MKLVDPCLHAKNHKSSPETGSWPCLGWLICLGPLLTACGGGGGGVIAPSATDSSYLKQTFTGAATLFNSDDQEFKNVSTSGAVHPFTLSKVESAYQKGLSGKGQTIVVVDTNFDASSSFNSDNRDLQAHPELQSKYNDASSGGISWNPDKPIQQGAPKQSPHGNMVASIAAAPYNSNETSNFYCTVSTGDTQKSDCYLNKTGVLNHGIHGVAFNAGLFLIDYKPSSFSLNSLSDDIASAASSAAKVMNNSWGISLAQGSHHNDNVVTVGSDAPSGMSIDAVSTWLENRTRLTSSSWKKYLSTLKNFQQSGVVVFALQNNSNATSASITAALPQVYPELRGSWIAVGNIETETSTGQQIWVSRRGASCLETAEYCLMADGTGLIGAGYRKIPYGPGSEFKIDYNGNYVVASGTSLAAPQVSGMIALLAEAFPNHTPTQLAHRLLASANNRFMINNGGQIQQVSTSGTTDFGNGVFHAYSEEFGHGIPDMSAALAPIGTTVIPTTAATLTAASTVPVARSFIAPSNAFGDGIKRALSNLTVNVYDGLYGGFKLPMVSLTRTVQKRHGLELNTQTLKVDSESATSELLRKPSYSLGLSMNKSLRETLSESALDQTTALKTHSKAPVRFSSLKDAVPFIDDNQDMRLDMMGNDFSIGGYFHRNNANAQESRSRFTQGISAFRSFYSGNGLNAGLAGGYQLEQQSFRNGQAGGALSLGPATSSWFIAPQLKIVNEQAYFDATISLSVSSTSLHSSEKSLIRYLSPYTTSGWRVSVGIRDAWKVHDELFARIWQPERVESGHMNIALPGLVGINETLAFSGYRVGLEPSGREVNLGLGYSYPVNNQIRVSFEAILSKDSGHVKSDVLSPSTLASLSIVF